MPIYTPSLLPNIASVNPAAFASAAPSGLQVAPLNLGPVYQGIQQAQQIQSAYAQQQFQQQQFQAQQEQQQFNNQQVMRKQKLEDLDRKNKITDAVTGIDILPKDADKLKELKRDHNINEDALNGAQSIEQMNEYRNNVANMLNDSRYREMQRDRLFYENSAKHINDPKNKAFFGKNTDTFIEDLTAYGQFGENSAGIKINREDIAVNKYYDSTKEDEERAFEQEYKRWQIQNGVEDNELAREKFAFDKEESIRRDEQNALLAQQKLSIDRQRLALEGRRVDISAQNASTTRFNAETTRLKQKAADQSNGVDNGLSYSQETGIIDKDSKQILARTELKMPNGQAVKNGANVKIVHEPNYNGIEQSFNVVVTDEETARKLSGYNDPWFWQSDDAFKDLQTKQKGVNGAEQNEWIIPGGTFDLSGRAQDELGNVFKPVSQGATPSPQGSRTTQSTNNQPSNKYSESSIQQQFIDNTSATIEGQSIEYIGDGLYSVNGSAKTGTADQIARYLNKVNK